MKLSQLTKTTAASVTLLAALTLNVQAYISSCVWDPAANPGSTGKWAEPASWHAFPQDTFGTEPSTVDYMAVFNVNPPPICILDTTVYPGHVVIGDNGPAHLVITNGGNMVVTNGDWVGVGFVNCPNGLLEITTGGAMFVHDNFWIGFEPNGVGTFIMNGGTATIEGMTGLGWNGGQGTMHINAGTLNLQTWHDTDSIKGASVLDVAGGTVIINGDRTTSVNTFIANGKITANGEAGTVNVDFNNTNPGKTTLTASGGVVTPAGNINSIEVSGGNVTIKYQTTPGSAYHLEQSPGVSPAAWSTVSGSAVGSAAGAEETYTFPAPSNVDPYYFRSVSP